MERPVLVNDREALRLRGNGKPDIDGYRQLLLGLGDGQALRVMMNGMDSRTIQEQNFRRAAWDLGLEVAFSQLDEDDNIPYLIVTRNPNMLRPHLPGQ